MIEDDNQILKSIECATKFYFNNKLVHQQKCTYPLDGSKLHVESCLITNTMKQETAPISFDINLPDYITVTISSHKGILPKSLVEAQKKCKTCQLRQRERGNE